MAHHQSRTHCRCNIKEIYLIKQANINKKIALSAYLNANRAKMSGFFRIINYLLAICQAMP